MQSLIIQGKVSRAASHSGKHQRVFTLTSRLMHADDSSIPGIDGLQASHTFSSILEQRNKAF